MGKILLIIKREYLTRVRKPAFIIMTLLGPILFAGITVLPVLIAQYSDEVKTIAVVDPTAMFYSALKDKETDKLKFVLLPAEQYENTRNNLDKTPYYGVLRIPVFADGGFAKIRKGITLESNKNIGLGIQSYIESQLTEEVRSLQLTTAGVDKNIVAETLTPVKISITQLDDKGKAEEKNSGITTGLGVGLGMLIYIFVFVYGAMVMRGVIEEKTSRIVEVIISSVKPFQLMMGKIIGVGMVGLTQFIAWVVLGAVLTSSVQSLVVKDKYDAKQVAQEISAKSGKQIDAGLQDDLDNKAEANKTINQIMNLPFGKIIFAFLFYFIGGYMLYGAFFAAIGGAVDSETDTQQFMLPVTLPIIFSIIMMQFVLNNPDGPVAFWLSIIPLTSPIIMMVRIPFDPPMWQVATSMVVLVITFVLSTWLAGRIYRTGILMYGKKPSWKELGKWLFYKG